MQVVLTTDRDDDFDPDFITTTSRQKLGHSIIRIKIKMIRTTRKKKTAKAIKIYTVVLEYIERNLRDIDLLTQDEATADFGTFRENCNKVIEISARYVIFLLTVQNTFRTLFHPNGEKPADLRKRQDVGYAIGKFRRAKYCKRLEAVPSKDAKQLYV